MQTKNNSSWSRISSARLPVTAIFFIFVVIILYWNSLSGGFVWDDRTYFIDNDILPNLKPWDIQKIFLEASNNWGELLPVRDFVYVLEYQLFGLNPFGYHIVSIGLYFLICFSAYILLLRIYSDSDHIYGSPHSLSGTGNASMSAFFVTLIFAVYPVHVETVAYISGQKDLLSALFSLLAMNAFYLFFSSSDRIKSLLVAGIVSYYLAVLSKLTAIVLPIVIALQYLLSGREKRPKPWQALTVGVVSQVPVIWWFITSVGISAQYWSSTSAITTLTFPERIIVAFKILGAHTILALKPFPLSFGYPFNATTSFDTDLMAGVIASVILLYIVCAFRKDPAAVLGCSVFFFFLLPVLQLHGSLNNASVYDRYLFMPVLGIAILIELFLKRLSLRLFRSRGLYLFAIASIVTIFIVITVSYIPTFRDDIASTRNTYEKFPQWRSSAFNYVSSLIEGGRLDEAYSLTLKEQGLSSPSWVKGYFRGWILLERGTVGEAIPELQLSSYLAVSGGYFPYPNIPLSRALIRAGRAPEAVPLLQMVTRSPISQPLESYQAKKLLEEAGVKGTNK